MNENKVETLEKIFKEKWVKWVDKFSILTNKDVINYINDMVEQYTDEGKDPQDFKAGSYIKYIQQYCDFFNCENPSELLKEDIDTRNKRVKEYLKGLQKISLEDAKALGFRKIPSEESIRNQIQGKIKGFYSNRGVNVSYGMKTVKHGANVNEIELDREMLKGIQAKLESIQYRLINKFESQTGLRIDDILNGLTNGKYKIEKYKKHYFIRSFKTKKEMVTINYLFFTQELSELLESAYPNTKLTELDLSGLFMSRGTKDDNGNIVNQKTINQNNYLRRLKAIVKELGIDGNIKTHCVRKYFETRVGTLIGAKVPNVENQSFQERFKTQLMGAEPNYRDSTYDNNLRSISWVYQRWLMVENVVCVDCIIVDNTSEDVKALKQENFELRADMIELKKDIDKLKEWAKELYKEKLLKENK